MNLRQRTFSAGRWTAASALLRALLQIVQAVVLARLLTPADFGLMAIVTALLVVIGLFADFGISRALIYFEHVPDEVRSSLFWLNLAFALALSLVLAALAPVLAALYGMPALAPAVLAASPVFVLTAAGQQFCVLAEKELRFAPLAVNEVAAAVLGFVAALVLAWQGAGVYALIGGSLVAAAALSVLAWLRLAEGRRPRFHLRLDEVRPHLRYGAGLVGENIASTLLRQADVFVGGLFAAPAALGVFALPRDLSLKVAAMVNPVLTRVGFPVMARLQNDVAALKSAYLHVLRMTASVNFPVYVALAVFADELVALLLGPQWLEAAYYLRLFALWGLVRATGNPVGSLLYATGQVRRALLWNVALLALLVPLYALAVARGGLAMLAWSITIAQIVLFVPAWAWLVRPACGAGFAEYLRQVAPAACASAGAGAAAGLAFWVADGALARVAIGGLLGTLAYALLSVWLNRSWVEALVEFLRPGLVARPRLP
jgi:O-antigen/teichoic acid export membrane protein